jgi:hypothetical protein
MKTAERAATKIRKSEFAGKGALIQFIGLICCFLIFPFGLVAGIILLVVGGRIAIVTKCSACRGNVEKEARLCPHCRSEFES